MGTRFSKIVSGLLLFCGSAFAQNEVRPVHIGLIYPLSTNWTYADQISNYSSIHGIAGVSESEKSFCASGVANVVKQDANGLIAAGVVNYIGHNANGMQAAGVVNVMDHHAGGFTAAGVANVSQSSSGYQAAGVANITKESKGVQTAGFINVAKNANTQIAGFINIAKQVSGVQLAGFINIADSSDYPIGIVNIVKNGKCGLGINIDEALTTMVSLRSGGRYLYGILGVGMNMQDNIDPLFALEAGLGLHIPIASYFKINCELSSTTLADFKLGSHFRGSYRLLPTFTIANKLEIFGGPTLNHVTLNHGKGEHLIHNFIWSRDRHDHFHGMYFGGLIGAHILL